MCLKNKCANSCSVTYKFNGQITVDKGHDEEFSFIFYFSSLVVVLQIQNKKGKERGSVLSLVWIPAVSGYSGMVHPGGIV
jgi:hypothetical protein